MHSSFGIGNTCTKKKHPIQGSDLNFKCQQKHNLPTNNFKTASTQTACEDVCHIHNQQITELLTEVAITLSQKSKLESELGYLKNDSNEMQQKFAEERKRLEEKLVDMRINNSEKDLVLSKVKVAHLEEQKELLTQINELKSQLRKINEEKDNVCHSLKDENTSLQQKLNVHSEELKNEIQKNSKLHLQILKYKTKLRDLTEYAKLLFHELSVCKGQKVSDVSESRFTSKYTTPNEEKPKISTSLECKVESNIENMILSELFFKPNAARIDLASLFFNQKLGV